MALGKKLTRTTTVVSSDASQGKSSRGSMRIGVVERDARQYAWRIHRSCPGKRDVRIFDYVDGEGPLLARIFEMTSVDTQNRPVMDT